MLDYTGSWSRNDYYHKIGDSFHGNISLTSMTRAVHLDQVPDLNTLTFLRKLKCFTSRCGVPAKMISDNAKTFKSASRTICGLFSDPVIKKDFSNLQLE